MADEKWRVLIGSRSFGRAVPEHIAELEQGGCEVVPNAVGRAYRESELLEALPGMDAINTGTDELTGAVIRNAPGLKTIAKHGVGLETIDLVAARILAEDGILRVEDANEIILAMRLTAIVFKRPVLVVGC